MKTTILSYKGGVGKSTIALNILVCTVSRGRSTALIDADGNQSSLSSYGHRPADKSLPLSPAGGNTDENSIVNPVTYLTRARLPENFCLTPSGDGTLSRSPKCVTNIPVVSDSVGSTIPVCALANRLKKEVALHSNYQYRKSTRKTLQRQVG